ncbi:MFS transporter [Streptomyces sp. NPDC059788]|uniref:MFS transporter n=1 Tax=Streptomyces sp. NPDC059788 TaxID=3346948 RepID=UPI0036538686
MTDHREATVAPRSAWLALAVLLAGAFMALLDSTIVNIAIPTIHTSLGASESTLSWVISGYMLAYGLALVPAGRMGDRYGHKPVFIVGLILFTVFSAACAFAQNDVQLILARIAQGLSAGIFYTCITALIQLMFPGKLRGKALAVMGAAIGFSSAMGPLAGGLIIEGFGAEHGWRYIFGVNLPIGVIAAFFAFRLLPTYSSTREDGRSDWGGLILLTAGLGAILVPLIQGEEQGWPLWVYVLMACGVLLIVGFALWERRVAGRGGNPMVPPRLFKSRAFTSGVVLALVYFAAFTSIFFTIALLWQAGLGASALETGLLLMAFAVGTIVGAAQSEPLAARFGRSVLIIGLGLVTLSLTAILTILAVASPADLRGWPLIAPLLFGGIGSGLFIPSNMDFIVATVAREEAGSASGVIGSMQRVGSAIGIAVAGRVLFDTLDFTSGGSPAQVFSRSATFAMAVSVAFAVLAFAFVFALPKHSAGEPDTVPETPHRRESSTAREGG